MDKQIFTGGSKKVTAPKKMDMPVFKPGNKPFVAETTPDDPRGGPVKAWSASTLKKFQSCPYSVKLNKVDKIPEESGEAANRGSRIHDLAEHYVDGTIGELPEELKKFAGEFENLRELYIEGVVECEGDWGFTIDWEPCGWVGATTWARMKLDVFVQESETSALIIDHKTGRKDGNEISHSKQAMIYAIGTFMRYPELEFIKTEFWYLDKGQKLVGTYTRKQAMGLMPMIKKQAVELTSCTNFKPKPSAGACRWCSYRKNNQCEWAYEGL